MALTAPASSWFVRVRRWPLAALGAVIARWSRAAGLADIATHHVYLPALGPEAVVIDAGANLGEFAAEIRRRTGARVVALEPVPELRSKIEPAANLAILDGAIVGERERPIGEVEIHLSENPQAHSSDPEIASRFGARGTIRVRAWTLPALLAELGIERVDLLKLDVEGAELEVLETASAETLGAIAQITVEFHDFLGDPEVAARVRAIRRRLGRFGFRALVLSAPWGHHADVLFLGPGVKVSRRARCHQALLTGIALPLRGLVHRLRRGPT
ncbi:MAG TPA: FkbM family methyltransferase [Thermoanaerobaculia bacterium]|jgi:FkbM family methyltransferase|nr:FkbM family methyltransferase [Thermoanaerobaculia bacterium]